MSIAMNLLRIRQATPMKGFALRLVLTDGTEIERDVASLVTGPVFDAMRTDPRLFEAVRVEDGAVTWPNGADLDPDVLIWGGPPPEAGASATPPKYLSPQVSSKTT